MINLRKVKSSDLNMLFLWRNNPEIVSLSASQKTVTLDEHSQWLNASINDINKIIHILRKIKLPQGNYVLIESKGWLIVKFLYI